MRGSSGNILLIRRYGPEDHESVWRLYNDDLSHVGARLVDSALDDDLRDIEGVYLRQGGEFLVGVCDGRVVAMGGLRPTSPGRAEIRRMRVAPVWQGLGFGQAILDDLEHRAAELGFDQLHLDTTSGQVSACILYLKNGYGESRRTRVGPFERVFYEKTLG